MDHLSRLELTRNLISIKHYINSSLATNSPVGPGNISPISTTEERNAELLG